MTQIAIRKKEIGNSLLSTSYLTSTDIKERVMDIANGLINPKWIGWYCKGYKTLGEGRFLKIAREARLGDKPDRLFSVKLKEELDKSLR